jgi:hypothetical protein
MSKVWLYSLVTVMRGTEGKKLHICRELQDDITVQTNALVGCTQCIMVVVYRCFWIAYGCVTGEDGTKTSVNNDQHTLRNIPKERRTELHRGGSLKSRMT